MAPEAYNQEFPWFYVNGFENISELPNVTQGLLRGLEFVRAQPGNVGQTDLPTPQIFAVFAGSASKPPAVAPTA